jgi:hypothetical protein
MASLTRKPRSKYASRVSETSTAGSAENRRVSRIAKKPSRLQSNLSKLDNGNLLLGQAGKLWPELYREIYSETLPVATIRKFIADWLQTKEPEVSAGTLAFYKKSIAKFLKFLGPAADLDLASITRTTVLEFKNHIAKRNSPVTTNADLQALKMNFRAAKLEGYIRRSR